MTYTFFFAFSLFALISSQQSKNSEDGRFVTMENITPEELEWVYRISADDYVPGVEIPPPKDAHEYEEMEKKATEIFSNKRKTKNRDLDCEMNESTFEIGTPKNKAVEEAIDSLPEEQYNNKNFNWKKIKAKDVALENYKDDIWDENGNMK